MNPFAWIGERFFNRIDKLASRTLDADSTFGQYLATWAAGAFCFTYICVLILPFIAAADGIDKIMDRWLKPWRMEKWVHEETWYYHEPKPRLVWKDAYSFATCEEAMEFAMQLKRANVYAWRIRNGKNIIPLDIL